MIPPAPWPRPPRRHPIQRERAEQTRIVQLLRTIGASVYVLGHPSPNDGRRHRGTGQTPGVPDLVAFLPGRLVAGSLDGRRLQQVWFEVKAPGGRLRPAQREFRDACGRADQAHVVGDYDAVIAWLVEGGYVSPASLPHYRVPKGVGHERS